METMNEIEENQINGMVYIIDAGGVSLSHLAMVPIDQWAKVGKNTLKSVAMRHKGFHVVNISPAFSFLINVALGLLSEKLKSRFKLYKSFDELDFIDKKSLPQEYGGCVPMKELSGWLDV